MNTHANGAAAAERARASADAACARSLPCTSPPATPELARAGERDGAERARIDCERTVRAAGDPATAVRAGGVRRGSARPAGELPTLELIERVVARRAEAGAIRDRDAVDAWLLRHCRASAVEWAQLLQIPLRAGARLACAFELGRRAAADARPLRASIRTPRDAFERVRGTLQGRDREAVVALYLDGRHRLLLLHEVSLGTATASLIHPREVFGPALRAGACAVVVAHNHPSGDPEPSPEDRGVTERLQQAGELVGVPLLDHLVVGGASFVSLRGRGGWEALAQREAPPRA